METESQVLHTAAELLTSSESNQLKRCWHSGREGGKPQILEWSDTHRVYLPPQPAAQQEGEPKPKVLLTAASVNPNFDSEGLWARP